MRWCPELRSGAEMYLRTFGFNPDRPSRSASWTRPMNETVSRRSVQKTRRRAGDVERTHRSSLRTLAWCSCSRRSSRRCSFCCFRPSRIQRLARRPGEVIVTRSGITVEVDNTDAEGRLLLCVRSLMHRTENRLDPRLRDAHRRRPCRTRTRPARDVREPRRHRRRAARLRTRHARSTVAHAVMAAVSADARFGRRRSRQRRLASGRCDYGGAVSRTLRAGAQAWCHLDVYSWNDGDRPGRPRR